MPRTKIVATIGPAGDTEGVLAAMIEAGVNVFRFNMKHNSLRWHLTRIERVKRAVKKAGKPSAAKAMEGKPVAIMMDLQGPEVRIGRIGGAGEKTVAAGKEYFLSKSKMGKAVIPVDSEGLLKALKPGDHLFLSGGQIEFEVKKKREQGVAVIALGEGVVEERKGVNFPEVEVELPVLLEKDLKHLSLAAKEEIDYVALSFTRTAEDIKVLRKEMKRYKLEAGIIAKIETKRAVENFDKILAEADGIMVARGDLGVEIRFEKVPYLQKEMIRKCRQAGKPVIVATEMLESMIGNLWPTRAEVSDVANAVYDGADALMLSGETAVGNFPTRAVKTMAQIAEYTERKRASDRVEVRKYDIKKAMVEAAYILATRDDDFGKEVVAFVVITDEGETARLLSRYRSLLPILALTEDKRVRDQLCLSYGVVPYRLKFPKGKMHSVKVVLDCLKRKGELKAGQKVILVHGEDWGTPGRTNAVRIQEVY